MTSRYQLIKKVSNFMLDTKFKRNVKELDLPRTFVKTEPSFKSARDSTLYSIGKVLIYMKVSISPCKIFIKRFHQLEVPTHFKSADCAAVDFEDDMAWFRFSIVCKLLGSCIMVIIMDGNRVSTSMPL
jgi:hypothetical protein